MEKTDDFELGRHIYHYGVEGREPLGFMCFGKKNGQILCYNDKNERRFSFDGRILALRSSKGQKTVEFERIQNSFGFRRVSGANHYLRHSFGLGTPKPSTLPKVLLNTIPKAGTYLVAEALSLSGYSPVRLHLADSFFHDNREVPDSQIHWEPDKRRVDIPADVISHILSDGEFVVGHIGDRKVLKKIREQDVQIVNVVRDPRSQLVSLFHFAPKKQHPTPRDMLWRSMPEEQRFKAFLLSQNVKSIVDHNRVLTSSGPFFCFEDISVGKVIEKGGAMFNSKKRRRVISDITKALSGAIGRPTSTLSDRDRSDDFKYFDDPAIAEFLAGPCRLKEYSEKYEEFLR